MLISDNFPVKKIISILTLYRTKIHGYCNVFLRIILKRISTEAHVYIRRHQGAKFEHFDVSNVIYHEFSHGAVSYTLSGENINVMLDSRIKVFRQEGSPQKVHVP